MKKLFLLAAGLALTLTACQKDDASVPDAGATSSFTVTIPQNGTRAVTDAFGMGTSANRCILEIYRGGQLYDRIEKSVSAKTVTFDNLRLVAQQTYDFVFWADCADGSEGNFTDRHYNTQSLKAISNRGTFEGNSDERDAFFAHESFEVTGSFSKPVTLTRPFGLLVVKTNDLDEIKDDMLKPTGYTVAFRNMPDTFNAMTGEVSGSTHITYTANDLAKAADGTISMDFLWAIDTEAALSDFTMTFLNNGSVICTNDAFTNIPIRRNYKTNVSGNLLTKKGAISVMINPDFEDEIVQDVNQVESIEAANAAFAAGKTNVVVTEAPTSDATLILPSTEAAVSATLPALTTNLKVQYSEAADALHPANFYLTTSSSAAVEIVAPNTTVTLAGASYADVTASTAVNTLIVSKETTVDKLTVKSGNVSVYGTLKAVASKPAGTNVVLHVSTADKLREFAAGAAAKNPYNKVVLDADIDFKGAAFSIAQTTGVEFEGQGYKLANFKVENTQTAGLVCNAISVKFRNLIIENASVKAVDDGGGNAYAGAFVGRSYGTIVFDNCQAVNSTIEGVNKVGGMIGFVAENHVEATDSKVVGCTVSVVDVPDESGQIGGFAGYLGSLYNSTCLFRNCSVESSTINAYMNRDDRTISKFIGCLQGSEATDVLSIDNCSVKNTVLNGMNEKAQAFVSTYGDLLGGQRYGKGTVKMTNSPRVYSLAYPAQLYKFAEMANADQGKKYFSNATVKLDADIDLAGENWVPVNLFSASKFTFDGQGHTISNMVATNDVRYGNGFFSNLVVAAVRNVTFDKAEVSRYGFDQGFGGNVYGIVSGYAYGATVFENVHVSDSAIGAYGKVGGILGMAADGAGITSFENCSVTNTSVIGCYNCGGLIGLAQNLVTLKDYTVDNVTWTAPASEAENYIELDTTLTDKNGNLVLVKGIYWKYSDWYYAAWGDYYTDHYYEDIEVASGGQLADGLCHNK